MNKRETDYKYEVAVRKFTTLIERAIADSHATTSLQAGERRRWGSVLFTRICTSSVSTLCLCPGSKANPDGIHWDFASIASLVRNIYECALSFFYLAVEKVSEDEWSCRLKVMQLHDCMARFRMFHAFDPADEQLSGFESQAIDLRSAPGWLQDLHR
ncbi:hypothetical protein BH10CYA1_BH10CYA1_55930 [soil metagenome]